MAKSFVNIKTVLSFNSAEIAKYVTKIERKGLQKAGAIMRARAMREIKPAPVGTAAAPGQSFHSHPTKKKGDSGIKRAIQYGLDPALSAVVVGPAYAQDIFRKHEEGLTTQNKRRRLRVGDKGLMVIGRTYKKGKGRTLKIPTSSGRAGEVPVVFAEIKTPKQLERAQELEETIYGPYKSSSTYPPRPVLQNTLKNNPNALDESLRAAYENY